MQSLRGTFATRGILIVIGALIAIAASAVTAVAVRAGAGGSTQTSVGAGAVAGPRDTITVVGEGTQNATPDNALISLGVSARRPTAADAMNTANAEMTALLKAIKGQGVLDADIQTTGISIYQDQQYTVIGYRAGNTVNVKVHHIANVKLSPADPEDNTSSPILVGLPFRPICLNWNSSASSRATASAKAPPT